MVWVSGHDPDVRRGDDLREGIGLEESIPSSRTRSGTAGNEQPTSKQGALALPCA